MLIALRGASSRVAFAGIGAIAGRAHGLARGGAGRVPAACSSLFFLSSMSLPRNLIAVDWFRTVATWNPASYLIEGLRCLVITGWDGTALWRGLAVGVGDAACCRFWAASRGAARRGWRGHDAATSRGRRGPCCGATSSTRSRTRRCSSRRSSSRCSSSSPSRAACRASPTCRASTSRRATRRSSSSSSSCSRRPSAASSPASRVAADFESGFGRRLLLGRAAARGHHRWATRSRPWRAGPVTGDGRHGRGAARRACRSTAARAELVGLRRRSRCWST